MSLRFYGLNVFIVWLTVLVLIAVIVVDVIFISTAIQLLHSDDSCYFLVMMTHDNDNNDHNDIEHGNKYTAADCNELR